MSDVQRAIALALIATFCLATILLTIRLVWWGDPTTLIDLTKTFQSAVINMGMVVLGYFFGSSKSKDQSDASQQQIVDKLTSTAPGTLPPSPPLPTTTVTPWWSKLTDSEKSAITLAGSTDPRIAAIVTAMTAGAATSDDLVYLGSKGLLTDVRVAALQS